MNTISKKMDIYPLITQNIILNDENERNLELLRVDSSDSISVIYFESNNEETLLRIRLLRPNSNFTIKFSNVDRNQIINYRFAITRKSIEDLIKVYNYEMPKNPIILQNRFIYLHGKHKKKLNEEEFIDSLYDLGGNKQFKWLFGPPGSGKSILMSQILARKSKNNDVVIVELPIIKLIDSKLKYEEYSKFRREIDCFLNSIRLIEPSGRRIILLVDEFDVLSSYIPKLAIELIKSIIRAKEERKIHGVLFVDIFTWHTRKKLLKIDNNHIAPINVIQYELDYELTEDNINDFLRSLFLPNKNRLKAKMSRASGLPFLVAAIVRRELNSLFLTDEDDVLDDEKLFTYLVMNKTIKKSALFSSSDDFEIYRIIDKPGVVAQILSNLNSCDPTIISDDKRTIIELLEELKFVQRCPYDGYRFNIKWIEDYYKHTSASTRN